MLIEDDPARARERLVDYAQRNYGVPLDFVEKIQVQIAGSRDEVAARLREYAGAGAEHVLIRIGPRNRPSSTSSSPRSPKPCPGNGAADCR